MVQKLLVNSQRASSITAAVANFIAEEISVRLKGTVEGLGFRKIVAVLEQRYQVPCHNNISKVLRHQHGDVVKSMKR